MRYEFINIICRVCGTIYEKTRKIADVKGICERCSRNQKPDMDRPKSKEKSSP